MFLFKNMKQMRTIIKHCITYFSCMVYLSKYKNRNTMTGQFGIIDGHIFENVYVNLLLCTVFKVIRRMSQALYVECRSLEITALNLRNKDIQLCINSGQRELLEFKELKQKIQIGSENLENKICNPIPPNIRGN